MKSILKRENKQTNPENSLSYLISIIVCHHLEFYLNLNLKLN